MKLSPRGDLAWVHSLGSTGSDEGNSICSDPAGNIYITGFYEGTMDCIPGNNSCSITSNGEEDIFIEKLNSDGDFIWAKSVGGIDSDMSFSITSNSNGCICLTGYFMETVDFDPNDSNYELSSQGARDIFVLALDANGEFMLANAMGGEFYERGLSVIMDMDENVYASGYFEEEAYFNSGSSSFTLKSKGGWDGFILKLGSTIGLNENPLETNDIVIYPNPGNGMINVKLGGDLKEASIRIYNSGGQLIYSEYNVSSPVHPIELNSPPGIYFLEIIRERKSSTFKLLLR
jgi:hypothetical protein